MSVADAPVIFIQRYNKFIDAPSFLFFGVYRRRKDCCASMLKNEKTAMQQNQLTKGKQQQKNTKNSASLWSVEMGCWPSGKDRRVDDRLTP
jgi:hypothetical protein